LGGRPAASCGPPPLEETHFLFAHLIAEVLDVLTLTLIAVGFSKRLVTGIAPVIPGAVQHR